MRFAFKLLVAASAFASSACVHSPTVGARVGAKEVLTPTQLIATAEARRGQAVTVAGYFTWDTDTRALWEGRSAQLDAKQQRMGDDFDYWSKCVTIYPASATERRHSDRMVYVTGNVTIIDKDDVRSVWTCNAVALEDAVISPL